MSLNLGKPSRPKRHGGLRILTDEESAELAAAHDAGWTAEDLAKKFGTSLHSTWTYIREAHAFARGFKAGKASK
jgi:hypothetical protein